MSKTMNTREKMSHRTRSSETDRSKHWKHGKSSGLKKD